MKTLDAVRLRTTNEEATLRDLTPARRPGNLLLDTLSTGEWSLWQPFFERVQLHGREHLLHPDESVHDLWFPEGGLFSQLIEMRSGAAVEVRLIGREGMLGLAGAFGMPRTSLRAIGHMPTTVLRADVRAFRTLCGEGHPFWRRIQRYAVAAMESFAHLAACNQVHHVDQRLCRWLLTAYGRVEGQEIPITHETLALLLGTRRASVSDAARALQYDGLIRYEPGRIAVVDPMGLHDRACECYDAIARLFDLGT